jgi:nitrate/nitrite transport system substrate-binding protein
LGFVPLTDCAPLVVALEHDLFARHGLDVTLSREVSWANIRDKVAAGVLDGAQMLASMPLATTLGLGEVQQDTITALSLDLNGNAITVSEPLCRRIEDTDPAALTDRPVTAHALKGLIEADRRNGKPPLTFAMVFPFSTHNYILRYWLAAGGVHPDRDVRVVVIPPPQMVDHLAAGTIDGFCVGEPWNAAAVMAGIGRTLLTDYEIWNNKPEKVFGVNTAWADHYPATHRAALMALLEACRWLDDPHNRSDACNLLARPEYVGVPAEIIGMSMTGAFKYSRSESALPLPDFNVFYRYAATFPWRSHAVWLLTQMMRWGQVGAEIDARSLAGMVYRPDLYRQAAAELGVDCPVQDEKSEGSHDMAWAIRSDAGEIILGPDRFIDGARFDPADPEGDGVKFGLHNRNWGPGRSAISNGRL